MNNKLITQPLRKSLWLAMLLSGPLSLVAATYIRLASAADDPPEMGPDCVVYMPEGTYMSSEYSSFAEAYNVGPDNSEEYDIWVITLDSENGNSITKVG